MNKPPADNAGPMPFADKLRELMRDRSYRSVADSARISAGLFHNYLKRGHRPGRTVAQRLADALGVDVRWLLDDARGFPPVYATTARMHADNAAETIARQLIRTAADELHGDALLRAATGVLAKLADQQRDESNDCWRGTPAGAREGAKSTPASPPARPATKKGGKR